MLKFIMHSIFKNKDANMHLKHAPSCMKNEYSINCKIARLFPFLQYPLKESEKIYLNSQNALSTEAACAAAGNSMSALAELQGK